MSAWNSRKLWTLAASLMANLAQSVDLPSAAIDNYRIETQYGSSDALLNPLYDRNSRLELSVGGAFAPLSSTGRYQAITGSVVYNINRRHSVEPIFYTRNKISLSNFVKTQIADKSKPSGATNDELSVEVPKQMWLASYYFSPYHSKLHLTSHSVLHFDIYFGAGAGLIQQEQLFLDKDTGKEGWGAVVSANAGMRFLFASRMFTRLDFKNLIYSSKDFGDSDRKVDLQMGLSIGMLL